MNKITLASFSRHEILVKYKIVRRNCGHLPSIHPYVIYLVKPNQVSYFPQPGEILANLGHGKKKPGEILMNLVKN